MPDPSRDSVLRVWPFWDLETWLDWTDLIKIFEKTTLIHFFYYSMHETCATDTNQVQLVISSVIDTIIQKNLQKAGMM